MQKKYLYLIIQQLVLLIYFISTTMIYFLALNNGSNGISLSVFGGANDGIFYWNQAKNIASGQEAVITSIYPIILGYLIKVTGFESVYLIRVFNYVGFVILMYYSVYFIRVLINNKGKAQEIIKESQITLLIVFMFYASLQMNVNLSIYRDVWIYGLYLISTLLSVKFILSQNIKGMYLVLLLLSLGLLGEFRAYALISFILTIFIYYSIKKLKVIKKPMLLISLLVFSFAIYYTFFKDFIVPIINMTLRDALNYRYSSLTEDPGGSQMWINLDQSSFPVFLINYIHSYIGNLLGPLPWHIGGLSTVMVFFLETIPMVCILVFLWKKRILLTEMQKYTLLHAFVWVALIAVTNDNIGTATRLRPIAWILILIVFSCVYSSSRKLKQ